MAKKIESTNVETTNETASTKSLRVNGQVVFAEITVRKTKGGEPVDLKAEIDFEGCSAEQVLLWAARTKIIDLQRALRLCDLDFIKDLAKRGPIRRKATVAGTGFADPAKQQQQIADKFSAMSPEEKAQLLALLQKNM